MTVTNIQRIEFRNRLEYSPGGKIGSKGGRKSQIYSICKTFFLSPHPLFSNTPHHTPSLKTQLRKTQPSTIQPSSFPDGQASKVDLFFKLLKTEFGKPGPNAGAVLSHLWDWGSRGHLPLLKATASPSAQNSMPATSQELRSLTTGSKLTSAAERSFSPSSRPYSLQRAFSKEREPWLSASQE